MKIDGKKPGVGTENYVKKVGEAAAGKKSESAKAPAGDKVDISTTGRELNRVKNLLGSVPEIRGEMVVRLKADIESGDYQVDAGKVAEKMIERALLNSLTMKK
ncbi:MAG: flagellar biosynthesis anti-sigma factor FlgM [Deltaproteobacteria bacterium]|nr:flagellar biosynthesis anti-sigma factor FlgM [Deltaproteobacteria bacterium]MBI5810080.1 flagellar biosynthesis anti-sigma factor FlgM [Deltaproteobacteria bacterium]